MDILEAKIRAHLERNGLLLSSESTAWKIGYSNLSGRGLVAQRDIATNELICRDAILVQGPRCYSKYLPMCVRCSKRGCALFPCDLGCGLPVCSNACQDNPEHADAECAYLRKLRPNYAGCGFSLELLQAVVPVRAVLLPEYCKDLVYCMQRHEAAQHGREVDMLKKNVAENLPPEDEEFMRAVCRAMDTNSLETAVVYGDSSTSLRALFPLGALTNHQCSPNTRHHVDKEGQLFVHATMPISAGQEITMSYTDLLWDTVMRRPFLQATKHFACHCPRCSDPTEFDSLLGALRCAKANCSGYLLPETPLDFNSPWVCNQCSLLVKSKQIRSIRGGIIAATEEVIYETPRKILRFVEKELCILVPEMNYFMIDMMFHIVSLFGRSEGLTWSELTDKELNIKIQYCHKLLQCLNALNCGDCLKKGLILYELYCANTESLRRRVLQEQNNSAKTEIHSCENQNNLQQAIAILKNNVITPLDYRKIYFSKTAVQRET